MAIFTERTERAIAAALEAHQGQTRKGDGQLPYIVHPVTVGLILSRYTDDEDTIIAGLLHDVLEDTPMREEAIDRDFGPKVLGIVKDVTEPDLPGLPWETRKDRYLRQLERAPRAAPLRRPRPSPSPGPPPPARRPRSGWSRGCWPREAAE